MGEMNVCVCVPNSLTTTTVDMWLLQTWVSDTFSLFHDQKGKNLPI